MLSLFFQILKLLGGPQNDTCDSIQPNLYTFCIAEKIVKWPTPNNFPNRNVVRTSLDIAGREPLSFLPS